MLHWSIFIPLTNNLKETNLNAFANRTDPDQADQGLLCF